MCAVEVEENTLWSKVTADVTGFAGLTGSHDAGIAIVGGGVAGISLAYHLAEAGEAPVVLEAATPGSDAAGKSAGIIVSLPVRHSPYEIFERYGDARGRRLVNMVGKSGKYVFSLVHKLGLDCAPQQTGFLAPARTAQEVERVTRTTSEWRSLGFGIETIDKEKICRLTGLDAYLGALLDPAGGAINPLAYVRELARAAAGEGARVFIDSPVTKIRKNGEGWCLESDKFRVNVNQVVLCAGGGNRSLRAGLARTVLPFKVFQMATEPLDAKVREVILPENHAMTDVSPDIFSIRYDRDGRLITACPAFLFNNAKNRIARFIEERLRTFSPMLASARIRYLWQGTPWIGCSVLPRFVKLSDGLFAIQACNGRGLAINTILGREVAGFIRQGNAENLDLLVEKPDVIQYHGLMSCLPTILINSARFRARVMRKITGLQRYN